MYASIKDQLKNLDIGILGELRVIVNCMSFCDEYVWLTLGRGGWYGIHNRRLKTRG